MNPGKVVLWERLGAVRRSLSGWEAAGVVLGWEIRMVGGRSAVVDSILQY
jgi:hypothetical protein